MITLELLWQVPSVLQAVLLVISVDIVPKCNIINLDMSHYSRLLYKRGHSDKNQNGSQ